MEIVMKEWFGIGVSRSEESAIWTNEMRGGREGLLVILIFIGANVYIEPELREAFPT